MCESEFLLVKQAAAERLGVSPDRLRIKYHTFKLGLNNYLLHSCFYVTSFLPQRDDIHQTVNVDNHIELACEDSSTCRNFFFYEIFEPHIPCILSGYSFEIV